MDNLKLDENHTIGKHAPMPSDEEILAVARQLLREPYTPFNAVDFRIVSGFIEGFKAAWKLKS